MSETVTALVVTYNRFELLLLTLGALQAQTRPVDRIVLLDNGSSDGTYARLLASGLDLRRVDYVRLDSNRGPARGFWQGMSYAVADGADWVWVMDDDVLPDPDCLESLLRALDRLPPPAALGYLQSRVVGEDGRSQNTPEVAWRTEDGNYPDWERLLKHGIVATSKAALTSTLIPRTTLERFPPPSPDFFMWGEDSDFTLRVTADLPAFLVGASRAVHLRRIARPVNPLTETDPVRLRYMRYKCRNNVYIRRRYYGFWPMMDCLWGAGSQFVRALARGNLPAARALALGTLSAFRFRPRLTPAADPALMAEHRVLLRQGQRVGRPDGARPDGTATLSDVPDYAPTADAAALSP